MITMLMTIVREFRALDSPTSPFSSWVNPGMAELMGLKARITSV